MELLTVVSRSDLKTELLKELERNITTLKPLTDREDIDSEQLGNILHWLQRLTSVLHERGAQLGHEFRDNDFITSIRQRSSIPGGTCDFDLPVLQRWLHLPAAQRRQDQEEWLATLDPIRKSVELVLKLIRGSAEPTARLAEAGTYQHSLDPTLPFQLVRITLPGDSPWYPEVSGGKHRFSVRFLEPQDWSRAQPTKESVEFKLTCCLL